MAATSDPPPGSDVGQIALLEGLAARPIEVGGGHVRLHPHRHGQGSRARARHLLAQHHGGLEVGAHPPVFLVVLHPEEAQLAHARPDGLRNLPRLLPILDVRFDLLLDERAHRLPEHVVLLIEDLHLPSPHRALTASRSTPPSAVRGTASAKTTTCGRLKRAILEATKSLSWSAV